MVIIVIINERLKLRLYAYKLEFIHPTTKDKLTFTNYPDYDPFTKFKKVI